MRFDPTPLAGVVEVSTLWHRDPRGALGRIFCAREFAAAGLTPEIAQCNLSSNIARGTVRGFHLQDEPFAEDKLVHCIAGRIYDVALDLRPQSPTFGHHHAIELAAGDGRMLYVPRGCAHGFQTLEDASAVLYYISNFHEPGAERGVRWDDPALDVRWPIREGLTLSERDRGLPLLADYRAEGR